MFDKNLYKLLKDVYRDNEICTFDPLCMNTRDGNCCACSYLDEVACEHFNKDLSRRYLYGYGDENSSEYVSEFLGGRFNMAIMHPKFVFQFNTLSEQTLY